MTDFQKFGYAVANLLGYSWDGERIDEGYFVFGSNTFPEHRILVEIASAQDRFLEIENRANDHCYAD